MAQTQSVATAPPLRDRVAAEVRAWRGRLNLSQADLGRILGVTQTQVSARLRGQMEFSLSEIETLAVHFGVHPAELMGYGVQTPSGPPPGIRGTGGGVTLISPIAPATGLEPVTCREQSWDESPRLIEPDFDCLPSAA